MYQDPVTFDATHSVIINTNHLPQVSESDWGTWRRLLNIPWPFTYRRPGQPIRNPFDRPVNEKVKWGIQRDDAVKEAALRWIVGGAVRYTQNGDKTEPMPQPIVTATESWRTSSDVLGQFVADNCIVERGHIIRTTEFLELFNEYLRELGKKEVSHNYVTSRLADLDESIEAKQVALGDKTKLSQRNAASPTTKVRGYLGLRWAERRELA
jgi:phage/plasmid-associated DNA primase